MPAFVYVSRMELVDGVYLAVVAEAVRPWTDVQGNGVEEQVSMMRWFSTRAMWFTLRWMRIISRRPNRISVYEFMTSLWYFFRARIIATLHWTSSHILKSAIFWILFRAFACLSYCSGLPLFSDRLGDMDIHYHCNLPMRYTSITHSLLTRSSIGGQHCHYSGGPAQLVR